MTSPLDEEGTAGVVDAKGGSSVLAGGADASTPDGWDVVRAAECVEGESDAASPQALITTSAVNNTQWLRIVVHMMAAVGAPGQATPAACIPSPAVREADDGGGEHGSADPCATRESGQPSFCAGMFCVIAALLPTTAPASP